jgi:hypothetical protein
MKPPTEADLIEIENHVLKTWQIAEAEGGNRPWRIVRTLEYLIEMARLRVVRPIPPMPPRKAKPKPVSSVQPKPKNR